jgi:hypothetical protein
MDIVIYRPVKPIALLVLVVQLEVQAQCHDGDASG